MEAFGQRLGRSLWFFLCNAELISRKNVLIYNLGRASWDGHSLQKPLISFSSSWASGALAGSSPSPSVLGSILILLSSPSSWLDIQTLHCYSKAEKTPDRREIINSPCPTSRSRNVLWITGWNLRPRCFNVFEELFSLNVPSCLSMASFHCLP